MRSFFCLCAVAFGLAGCGGGGSAEVPAPIAAGIYASATDNRTMTVLVDGEGRMVGSLSEVLPHANSTFVGFSGTMAVEGTQFTVPDALVSVETFSITSSPATATGTSTVTMFGDYTAGQALSFTIPSPPMPSRFTPTNTLPYRVEGWITTASITFVAGRYRNTSTGADLTISAQGQVSGRISESCIVGGSLRITQPTRNVYTTTLAFSGAGCPGAPGVNYTVLGYMTERPNADLVLVLIGNFDGGPATFQLTKV